MKRRYDSIFMGIHKQHINKRRRKKENRRKSNERKRKRTENNVQRVYGICFGNPLGNNLPQCLVYPPRTAVRKSVLKLRMLPRRYLEEMGHTSHSSWKGIILPMLQEAESPPILSRKSEIMFTPSCTLKSTL